MAGLSLRLTLGLNSELLSLELTTQTQHKGGANMNTSINSQHKCIEQALRGNPSGLTTIELVEQYDIMRPGARICEMRWELGLNIKSVRVSDTTAQGMKHRVVRYVLMPGKWQKAAA